MTPAIDLAEKLKIDFKQHAYDHDPLAESYGLEAIDKLGVPAERVFKTLVVTDSQDNLAVAVVPVLQSLSLKKMANALKPITGAKKVTMAEPKRVESTTGYVLGGVSPLGQKKRLPTLIDITAQAHSTIFVSAGRRGLEIELSPEALGNALGATFAEIASD